MTSPTLVRVPVEHDISDLRAAGTRSEKQATVAGGCCVARKRPFPSNLEHSETRLTALRQSTSGSAGTTPGEEAPLVTTGSATELASPWFPDIGCDLRHDSPITPSGCTALRPGSAPAPGGERTRGDDDSRRPDVPPVDIVDTRYSHEISQTNVGPGRSAG